MEVSGAALANVISYSISLCVAVYFLISQKKIIPKNGWYFDQLRNSFKRLIFIALPAGITNIIQPLSVAIITSFLASEGAHVVAAFGIATRVEALAMLLVISLALGLSPIVGQNWGARNFSRVHEAIVLSIRFNFIWAGIVTVILWMFAEQIAGAFSSDAGVIHQATLYFWIVPFSYGFSNLVFGWSASFNAMGLPQWSFAMIILKSFAITIPCVALGYILGGALGVFISLAVANIISGVIFHLVSWRVCRSREKTLIVV
jgi:Na+-driven multidrug efflux pump